MFLRTLVLTLITTPLWSTPPALSPHVAAVRNLGSLFTANPHNITGQDCASSVPLPQGGALWLFGDTVEGPFESIRNLPLADKLSSTAAIVPPQDVSQGIKEFRFLTSADGQRAREVIEFRGAEDHATTRLWPMHGVCVRDEVYVFYNRISLLPGVDVFENFKLEGMGFAQATIGEWRFKRLATPGNNEFWPGEEPTFGVFVTAHDEYIYLWGSLMTGMFLARTRPEQLADLASYEYLVAAPTLRQPDVKPRWSPTFAPTAVLFDSVPNEMSGAYNPHLGCFVAIHTFLRERKIVLRTAPQLTGPWSEPQLVYEPPALKPDDLIYAAKEHPELAREKGRVIYVTFVNSTTYQPQLLEIQFK